MAVVSHSFYFYYSIFIPLSLLFIIAAFSPPSDAQSFADDHSLPPLPLLVAQLSARRILEDSGNNQRQKLEYDFYRNSYPNAETIINQVTRDAVENDEKITARLLRLMFHDCFIQGCDASVLLDDSKGNENRPIEKNAVPNQAQKGFDIIDRIKEALEAECPNTVSCSDIISLATRNTIALSKGPFSPVLTGRRGSRESYPDDANNQIPRPEGDLNETMHLFSQRSFNEKELVSLLGAHNIGKNGCEFILKRLS